MAFMRNDRVKLIGKATKPSDSALQKTHINRAPPPQIAFGRAPESKRKKHTRFHHQTPKTSRFYDLFAEGAKLLPKKEFLTYLAIVFLVANIGPARLGAREADAQRSTHGNVEAAQSRPQIYGQKTFDVELANGTVTIRNFKLNNGDVLNLTLNILESQRNIETRNWIMNLNMTEKIAEFYHETNDGYKTVHVFFKHGGFVSAKMKTQDWAIFTCNRNSFEQVFAERGIDLNGQEIRNLTAMRVGEGINIGTNYYVIRTNNSEMGVYACAPSMIGIGRYRHLFGNDVPEPLINATVTEVNGGYADVRSDNLFCGNDKVKFRINLATLEVTVLDDEQAVSLGALK
ncbi:MAG: hypothetical protein WC588_02815 [Candidatus Micrarchaeia archaeon]